MSKGSRTFSVGGLSTTLHFSRTDWLFVPEDPTPKFLSKSRGELDLTVSIVEEDSMPEWQKQGLSDSEAWGISRDGSHFWIFAMHHRSRPVRVLRVNSSWTQGDIYLNQSVPKIESTFPLEPPLGELFYNHWAANREGLILHGATLVKDGIGIIAMGHSGAGKSTLSRLWADQFGPESVLTDERTLLRRHKNGQFYAYGTPWQGSGAFARNQSVPVQALVTLGKSPNHAFTRKARSPSVADLLGHMLLPAADRIAVEKAMEVAAVMAESIPAGTFSFSVQSNAAEHLVTNALSAS